jgi:uncharacterized oxidoreductase
VDAVTGRFSSRIVSKGLVSVRCRYRQNLVKLRRLFTTNAALHSYALTLRHLLKSDGIEVIEICPPHVDTDLGGARINKAVIPVDTFADAVMDELRKGTVEVTYWYSTKAANASRQERDELFKALNAA